MLGLYFSHVWLVLLDAASDLVLRSIISNDFVWLTVPINYDRSVIKLSSACG